MTMQLDPDLAGVFANGYEPEDAADVFDQIAQEADVDIICVWDYFDCSGYGGDSRFYVRENGASGHVLYELAGGLWPWLFGDVPASRGPGEPSSWRGSEADFDLDSLPVGDSDNYAHTDRS